MRRDLIALPDNSKVWIYQSQNNIEIDVGNKIKKHLYDFTMQWTSHGKEVESYGHLFHNKFLVLVADETNHVSGCSIDSSVHFIKQLEQTYNLDFFDRLNFAYLKDETVHKISIQDLKQAYNEGTIDDETLMFDNLVKTKDTFISEWIIPFKDSWYTKYLT